MGWRGFTAVAVTGMLLLAGCSPDSRGVDPDAAQALAGELAAALQDGDVSKLDLTDAKTAQTDYEQVTANMAGLTPTATVAGITYSEKGTVADVVLDQEYQFPQGSWTFQSHATMRHSESESWQIDWAPTIIHPQLSATTRLNDERTKPVRGTIRDNTNRAIVENRTVYRVGIDKSKIPETDWDAAARQLAQIVEINPDEYAAQVAASGPLAFVVAITFREGQVPNAIAQVSGATAIQGTLPLAPTATFARGLLGVAGEATAEAIEESNGAVEAGDIVGLSGVQKYEDERLRGTAGHAVTIIPRSKSELKELPPPAGTESATPSPDTSASPSTSASNPPNQTVFSVEAVNGQDIQLTLNMDMQQRAEQLLSGYGSLVMAVVLDRNTGGIVAAANSPAAESNFFATTGAYPPGSTMKVVTSLAMIRRGYNADSPVNCSTSATINGRTFTNYPGFPSAWNGNIPLRDALAQSCNTAFINASTEMSDDELANAAASLGLGVDYHTYFDAFYGSIPAPADVVTKAANNIGQGQVQMSPMAMAGMAASVGSGSTKIPYLVADRVPESTAAPLSENEAAILRDMMGWVVQSGTLTPVRGSLEGGKSGTAEFTEDISRNHIWTVGYNGQYAIAAMDYETHNQVPNEVVRALLG